MKNTLFLLLFIPSLCNAQSKKNGKWQRLGLITGSIILSAVGDGLQDEGKHKVMAHGFKTASALSLLAIPIFSHVSKRKAFKYALSYGLMRYGIFDLAYNKTRGLPYGYVGTTSIHDKLLSDVPKPMLFLTQATSIWISIELNNREVK